MEIDIDDVPWKDDLITEPLDIKDGYLRIPARPGWGADLNEREIAKHPWTNSWRPPVATYSVRSAARALEQAQTWAFKLGVGEDTGS